MQSMPYEVAKKLVSYVRENPGSTLEQVVQNVSELADIDLRDFAVDGSPNNHDSLIIIDEERRVYLGDAAHLTEWEHSRDK